MDGVIASPPFLQSRSNTTQSVGGIVRNGYPGDHRCDPGVGDRTYRCGDPRATDNIESLKPGYLDAVIGSPPYAQSLRSQKDSIHTGPISGEPKGFHLDLRRDFVVHLET